MAESISYLPGYDVRVLLVIQSLSQLREVYGVNNAETMLKSLGARIVFAPKDITDAKEISEELGYVTVKGRSRSKSTFWAGPQGRSPTINESDQRRALRLPQELRSLGGRHAIVFYEHLPPIWCRKIRYYRESAFRRRLQAAPAVCVGKSGLRTASEADSFITGGSIACGQGPEIMTSGEQRTPGVAELANLSELALEDFEIPDGALAAVTSIGACKHGAPIADGEILASAEAFIASLERGR